MALAVLDRDLAGHVADRVQFGQDTAPKTDAESERSSSLA
jgi:hypothetical protein